MASIPADSSKPRTTIASDSFSVPNTCTSFSFPFAASAMVPPTSASHLVLGTSYWQLPAVLIAKYQLPTTPAQSLRCKSSISLYDAAHNHRAQRWSSAEHPNCSCAAMPAKAPLEEWALPVLEGETPWGYRNAKTKADHNPPTASNRSRK